MKKASEKTFLGNLPISWRIGFLIVLGMLALAVLEIFSIIGQNNLSQSLRNQEAYVHIELNMLKVDAGALTLRRREKDFIIRKDPKYWDKYEKDHARVIGYLQTLKAAPEAIDVLPSIDAVISNLTEHRVQFQKVVEMFTQLGLTEKQGLKGRLRNAVHGVESKLKEFNLDALTVKMLMMRRHEKDFMLRGAEKYLDRLVKRRTEFNDLLATTNIPDDEKTKIAGLMAQYHQEMQAFGALSLALAPEIKRLSEIYAQMASARDVLFEFADDNLQRAEENAQMVEARRARRMLIGAGLVGVILLVAGILIMRSLTLPLGRITTATTRLANGQRDIHIPATGNTDEVGAMARALVVFKDNLAETERLQNEQQLAEERAVAERRAGRMKMADDFEGKVGVIVNTVSTAASQMQANARSLTTRSGQTSEKAQTVDSAAKMASSNVESVATATEELSASISEISRQVEQSSDIAKRAVSEAGRSDTQVQSLADAVHHIVEVVSLISDIAAQTNMLALNATIEAARAGDAGKGFAVVANEVKSLAHQTAQATEEISTQVSSIQTETDDAVKAIGSISETIGQISDISAAISAAVEQQHAATNEIARNVQQAFAGTGDVTANIGDVTQAAAENGESAKQLLHASDELSQQAELLSHEVNDFLTDSRKG